MDWKTYIHSDPKITIGKPVIKGTRLSVEFILGLFSEGWTEQQVLENYPTLNTRSIQAVFAFAAEEPAAILLNLLQTEELPIEGWFTIVERDRIRQRPLP